jgi:signal transduction histidine kinase/DNA-binding NarL/FixJ family response regulator
MSEVSPLRVLLVEDNTADAVLIEELLRDEDPQGYEIVRAKRLDEGLATVRNELIDVVLLDLSLPDAHGTDTVARMRSAAHNVPVVVLTGNAERSSAVEMLRRGAQDYLVKGKVDGATVARAIAYAIARSKVDEAQRRLAIEQAARDEAEAAEQRARFLADAGRVLASTLDHEKTPATVARLAVGVLADYCVVDLAIGSDLRRAAVAHVDGSREPLVRSLLAEPPSRSNTAHPVVRAMETRRSVVVDDLAASRALGADHAHADRLGGRCALSVPLIARDRVLGAVTFFSNSDFRYAGNQRGLAEELVSRASVAIDNGLLYAAAQQAVAAREETIAVVSHDLRTPLTLVALALQRLHREGGDPAVRDDLFRRGQRAIEAMGRLINDLLDLSRVDAGTLVVHGEPCAPADLVHEAVELHRPLAIEKAITLTTRIAPGLPQVVVERGRILQVFANLIANALKFTPTGGTIELRAEAEGRGIRFAVRDTGAGIPEAHLHKVFDRFWRPRNDTSSGAGLGLAIVKGIIEAHGGKLAVESKVGVGTTFCFTVPARPSQPADVGVGAGA